MRAVIASGVLTVAIAVAAGPAPAMPVRPAAGLPWDRVPLDADELAALARGVGVAKALDTRNSRDVAVFGIIKAGVTRAQYEAMVADFAHSLQGPTRLRFGIFHDPAVAADVEAVSLDHNDVSGARTCRPGNCILKLPSSDMARIRSLIDWSPPADPSGQLNRYLRQRLVEFATDYRGRGDPAMPVYDDVGPVRGSDAFAALAAQAREIYGDIPSLRQYFATYPHVRGDGVRDVLFWAQDSVPGLKSILSVSHEIVYHPPEFPGVSFAATKQIYAGHFFEAAFELTAIVEQPSGGIYLIALRLWRFDELSTAPIIGLRGRVTSRLREQLLGDLSRQKTLAERLRG